jgi:periplasmic protein CpxP/Spy
MKKFAFAFIILSFLYPSAETWARGPLKNLNLSEEQRSQIQSLKKGKNGSDGDRQALRQKRQELETALSNPSASRAELQKIHNELQKLRGEMAERRFNHMMQIREILTPEQRVEMAKLKGKGKKGMEHKRKGKKNRKAE